MRTARIVAVATAIGATAGAAVVLSLGDRAGPTANSDGNKTVVVVRSLVQPAEAAVASAPPAPVVAAAPAVTPSAPAASAAPAQANAQPVAAAIAVQPDPQPNTPRVALVRPVTETSAPQVTATPPPAQASIQALPEAQDKRAPSVGDALAAGSGADLAAVPAAADSAAEATPAAPASVAALAESPPAADAAPAAAQAIDDSIVAPEPSATQKGKKHHGVERGAPPSVAQANAAGSKKHPVDGEHGIGPLLRHIFSGGPTYYPR